MGPTKGVRSGGSACGPRPDATRNRSAGDPGRPLSGQRAGRFNHHISPTPAAPPQLRARTSSGGGGGCIPGLWRRRREVSGSGLWRRELSGSGHQRRDLSGSGLQRWELGGSGLRIPESVAAAEEEAAPPPPGALRRIPKEGSAATGSDEGSSAAPGSDGRVTHRTSPARRRLSQGCCHSPTLSWAQCGVPEDGRRESDQNVEESIDVKVSPKFGRPDRRR